MSYRRIAGLVLALAAGWLLWLGVQSVMQYVSRGASLGQALMDGSATSLMWITGSGLACLGGLVALAGRPGGAWLAGLGTLLFAVFTGLLMQLGDISLWRTQALVLPVMILSTLVLVFNQRRLRF